MLTQILPNIYAIRVPVEAHSFDYENSHLYYDLPDNILERSIQLPLNRLDNFEIMGCCTTTEVDFDCSGIVEVDEVKYDRELYKVYGKVYDKVHARIYSSSDHVFAFRSLLTSKGIEPTETEKILILKQI